MGHRFKAHPWHSVPVGSEVPASVMVDIEIVPADAVKYELDKATAYLHIDCPAIFEYLPRLYRIIPQTFCNGRVAELWTERAGR